MARIKYFNPYTGKWEYADSQFTVGSGGYDVMLRFDTPQGESLWADFTPTADNLTLVSGDVGALRTKWENGEPAKVGVILHTYYWNIEHHGFTEGIGCQTYADGLCGVFCVNNLLYQFCVNNDGTTRFVSKTPL